MPNIPYNIGDNSITAFFDGKPHTIRSGNASFDAVREALLDNRHEEAKTLFNNANAVKQFGKGKLQVVGNKVLYGDFQLHGVVIDKLLSLISDGVKDVNPLINFITKLQSNPSRNSVQQLYSFLEYKELPITPDGNVLGYKYVGGDYYSCHGNKETRVIQGVVDEDGHIYNGIGETIEVNRGDVDDNMNNCCSHGLHIGSFDYARSGARMIVVEFDPADAVSVPTDCSFQKLRVCKYKVVSEITDRRVEIDEPIHSYNDDYDPYADNDDDGYCSGECASCGCCPDHEDGDYDYDEDYVIQDQDIVEKIEDYINHRHENSVGPSIKEVQSRMKGYPLTSKEIYHTAKWLGYNVDKYDTQRTTIIREAE